MLGAFFDPQYRFFLGVHGGPPSRALCVVESPGPRGLKYSMTQYKRADLEYMFFNEHDAYKNGQPGIWTENKHGLSMGLTWD